jgi:hypothetical protein
MSLPAPPFSVSAPVQRVVAAKARNVIGTCRAVQRVVGGCSRDRVERSSNGQRKRRRARCATRITYDIATGYSFVLAGAQGIENCAWSKSQLIADNREGGLGLGIAQRNAAACRRDSERLQRQLRRRVVDVGIIGEKVEDLNFILARRARVIDRYGGVVDRIDRDADRLRGRAAVAIRNGNGKGVAAIVVGRRVIGISARRGIECQCAVSRSATQGNGIQQHVAGIGVRRMHRTADGCVLVPRWIDRGVEDWGGVWRFDG